MVASQAGDEVVAVDRLVARGQVVEDVEDAGVGGVEEGDIAVAELGRRERSRRLDVQIPDLAGGKDVLVHHDDHAAVARGGRGCDPHGGQHGVVLRAATADDLPDGLYQGLQTRYQQLVRSG